MIKHVFFAVTIGFFLFFIYLFQYTGAFRSVAVGEDERGPFTLLYQEHNGAYHKIVEKITTVESWAKENKINCRFTFGEFFDNPQVVEEGRLKSRGGCLLDSTMMADAETLKKLTLPENFKLEVFQKTKCVVALFNGSPGIGPLKVYPKVDDYMNERHYQRAGAVMEIYEVLDKNNMHTTYLFPLK